MNTFLFIMWIAPCLLMLLTYFEEQHRTTRERFKDALNVFCVSAAALYLCASALTLVMAFAGHGE